MKIHSFNVTDVGYHYIGLRVLDAMPEASKEEQWQTISRSVLKFARDRAIRLMLPEPRSNFETVGEKVCQELGHFEFAEAPRLKGYTLTTTGREALNLLNDKQFVELRRMMVSIHLRTYSNLFSVVRAHIANGDLLSPVVETGRTIDLGYVEKLLTPSFNGSAQSEAKKVFAAVAEKTPKAAEDTLREVVLAKTVPNESLGVPLFRAMCDRLISVRLLNTMKMELDGCEFLRSYSPCTEGEGNRRWHQPLEVTIPDYGRYTIYLSEPDMEDAKTRECFLEAVDDALAQLKAQAGYFDLPDVRDLVCEGMRIPEAAFDDGVNALLDLKKPPVTLGLTYDRISGRRKPLVRTRENTQIFNLIARV